MTRIAGSFLAALTSVMILASPAPADPIPADATWEQVWFPSADGTMLHADVFLPKDRQEGQRHPVILSIGPYFGTGGSLSDPTPNYRGPVLRFRDLIEQGRIFERGYAYVQVDLRGFGGSGGCGDLGGDGEQMDVKAAVEWAASQPWSTGKVGMWGKSYDAWTQVMALSEDPNGLAAAVIQAPIIELYRGLYMNGVSYGWNTTPVWYADLDLAVPSLHDSPPEEFVYPVAGTAANPHCYLENVAMTQVPLKETPYYEERDIVDEAARSHVPVLWSHGLLEANAKPDNFLDVWGRLRGAKRAWVGQYSHVRGNEVDKVGRSGFMREAMAWLDHYLKGRPLPRHPRVEIQDNEGKWRGESQWPPRDAKTFSLPLNEGTYVDAWGNTASAPRNGIWSISQRAPYDAHLSGVPRLNARVAPGARVVNLVAMLFDVDPSGSAKLITRGALLVRDEAVEFDLYPQDWRVRKGHRLALFVSGSDDEWFLTAPTNVEIEILHGSLDLPFLRFSRSNDLKGGPAEAMRYVPRTRVGGSDIRDAAVRMDFPPPLKRRAKS